jgi:prephenate dehydratase
VVVVSVHIFIFHAGSQANVTVAVVVPLVLVLLVLILLTVLVAVLIKIRSKPPKTTVHVVFSVEDNPGSLAAALKVFKDCNINILGLNTHLHHAGFDRNAGNGYKFNYIHCICTKDDKDFLKNELKAELKEGNKYYPIFFISILVYTDYQEHVVENITAIITVKDSPGALWNAIHKIGVSIILLIIKF